MSSSLDITVEADVEDNTVACSRELLNVVLLNLVGNSLKVLEGRETRWVRIRARSHGDSCAITIGDSGPGIPADAVARVFEPF